MNILIAAEKPAITRAIAPFVRKHWPADNITFVHVVPYGNIGFRYPRGLTLHDFPLLTAPRDRLRPLDEWHCPPAHLAADGSLSAGVMSLELFESADLIVSACDPDHTGAVAFDVVMREVLGDGRAKDCPALLLSALDAASIEFGLAHMLPFGQSCARSLEMGRMKRYFDWNWNVNSLVVLGEAQRRAGVPADAPPLSKYALQLLYGLRNRLSMTEGAVVSLMHDWKGTGRYVVKLGEWNPRLGSPAARVQILENLIDAGLVDRIEVSGKANLEVSGRGNVLLELLHPDCKDADLPFRLNTWCLQGMSSKPAIDRYINTFFGKQLEFMGRTPAGQLNKGVEAESVADWGSSCWVTIVELEFQHVMRDRDNPNCLGPRPDRLHAGLNTAVTAVTNNGLLVWLPDGTVVHADWSVERQCFTRRDKQEDLALADVRAWAAMQSPIAET
ncbi:hypothetical protein G3A43_07915 [Paraburkholderia aspalathi]|nr:hypothetical protein [Paraburkholderia aspalathi]MBK3780181.1 hypothetical protein [Paraburkholderia aspalathi]